MEKPPGRVALVVGGGRGLGAAVVRRLATGSFAVAIHCHASLREARALAAELGHQGVSALAVTANLREEGAVRALVHRVCDHFGRLDLLVACAGICRPANLEELSTDDLRAHLDVACVGAFVAAQEAGLAMIRQETGGEIVLVADHSADDPTVDHVGAVTTAAAVHGLARALAEAFARRQPRVRVHAVRAGAREPATVEAVAILAGITSADPAAGGS